MARLIDADAFAERMLKVWDTADEQKRTDIVAILADLVTPILVSTPTIDAVEVVRCKDCECATELDKHCELSRNLYRHCNMGRGEDTRHVWHKYKKYYKDYSLIEVDGFCDFGVRKDVNDDV